MKRPIESKVRAGGINRFLWIGCFGLLLVFALQPMAQEAGVSKMFESVKQAPSLVIWYMQSGQWRADMNGYLTQAEYLLCPTSNAGARLDMDLDE